MDDEIDSEMVFVVIGLYWRENLEFGLVKIKIEEEFIIYCGLVW